MGTLTVLFPSCFYQTPENQKQRRNQWHEMAKVLEEYKEALERLEVDDLKKNDCRLELKSAPPDILRLVVIRKRPKFGFIPREETKVVVEANVHTGIVVSSTSRCHLGLEVGLGNYAQLTGQNIVLNNHWIPVIH